MTEIIGRGELTALKIFRREYPQHKFRKQVPLKELINTVDEKSRLYRSSVDIVCYVNGKDKTQEELKACQKILIHIDDNHHRGPKTAKIDFLIDWYADILGHKTIRIREINCPYLFSDSNDTRDPKIMQEILNEISAWKVEI